MKKNLLSILLALSTAVATAQSYTISPSTTIDDTALCNQLNIYVIYQHNISGNTLNLAWNFISNTMPADWIVSYCDNFNCYTWPNIPATGTMTPVAAGGQSTVNIDVAAGTPGAGTLVAYIYDMANPSNGDTLTWNITSDCTVGIAEQSASNISVFPNPVSDYLNVSLDNHSSSIDHLIINNALGQPLYEQSAKGIKDQRIDVSGYPAGVYTLVLIDQNGKQVTKSFIR